MKTEHKIIAFSIILGLLAWVIDTLLDFLFFYKGPFWGILISDLPVFELYTRSLWMIFFLIFGIIMSGVIVKSKRVEEELLKFRLGIERSGEAIFITDINGTIVYINPAFENTYGYSSGEALGKTPRILKSGVLPQEAYKQFWDTLLAKKVMSGEIINKTKDGRLLNIESSANPILDTNGDIIGFLTIQRDITERKQAEVALKESEERYRWLVELSPDAIAIHSEGRIVFSNTAGAKLLGATGPEQLIGKKIMDIVHPDYREIVKERVRQMREEGKNVSLTEEKFIRLDGSAIDVEVTAMPFTYQGKPGMQVIVRDITRRKQAEEKIRDQAALLDNAQDAILVRNLQDHIIYWNNSSERLYGWTAEEAIGKNANEFLFKEKSPGLIEAKKSTIEKGEWSGELRLVTKDGKEIIIESRWTLMHDTKGKPKSILVINTDVTEKKKLEAQLLRAQRMESIGTLSSGIAHDLNNILTPMMLSLQILEEKFTDEQSQRLFNILETNVQRGANLIKQVTTFARGVEGEHITLQVKHLISEIKKIVKETFPRSIEIRTNLSKDLWSVDGDATQLHQVLMNLCVNARDAMPDGGILNISAENLFIDENSVRVNVEARVGPYIAITVSDTGTGIPPEIQDRIFEPFFTTKEPGKGTGLGLSTVLAIVKSHGGFINVYSEVGKGTIFKVYLPAATTAETQKAEEQQLELPAGHGELILIVDDEAQIREITRAILETHGYRVLTANNGEEAISLYSQNKEETKIVLMDMMMPTMDGSASIWGLRKINPEVKIIATSGLTENNLSADVGSIIQSFLSKPYTAEKLLKTVHDSLRVPIKR